MSPVSVAARMVALPSPGVLQLGPPADPLAQLFVLIVLVGVAILLGRFALGVAWRLVTIAAVVVGGLLVVSRIAPGVL